MVFALCRPPGHHATRRVAAGYCYLNNAAIAAQAFTNDGAKRVAVLDVDYHHGNGTQDIFYDRDDVLFVSIHADPAFEYPSFRGYAAAASGSQLSVVAGTRSHLYRTRVSYSRGAWK